MNLKKIWIISLLCAAISLRCVAHEISHKADAVLNLPQEIVQALNEGNAKVISKYFNSSVELIFSENRGVYSKTQAEQILKNFFTNNAAANGKFEYIHRHTSDRKDKENVQYYIGELRTGKGRYRIHIFMKEQRIYEMRIESND